MSEGYVDERDRDCVAFILGEAAANRNRDPAAACILARLAKALADQSHREEWLSATHFPTFEAALPTHDERIWGPPIDERIIARLDEWINAEVDRA